MTRNLPESKNCIHGYKGKRHKIGKAQYTSCPLCEIEAKRMQRALSAFLRNHKPEGGWEADSLKTGFIAGWKARTNGYKA